MIKQTGPYFLYNKFHVMIECHKYSAATWLQSQFGDIVYKFRESGITLQWVDLYLFLKQTLDCKDVEFALVILWSLWRDLSVILLYMRSVNVLFPRCQMMLIFFLGFVWGCFSSTQTKIIIFHLSFYLFLRSQRNL